MAGNLVYILVALMVVLLIAYVVVRQRRTGA